MSITTKNASGVSQTLATSTTAVAAQHTTQHVAIPDVAGGCSTYSLLSAASTNATSVKASAGQLYGIQAFTTNSNPRFLKLYNLAVAPTVGTSTVFRTYPIPGSATGNGFVITFPYGIEFTVGLAFALTTGVAGSDTGAVASNECVLNIDYK